MSKEKLKFKIGGKSIVYEGNRDNRTRDLLDIMAKMSLKDSDVIPAFRENIEDAGAYTDDQISQLYATAVRSRSEKKARNAAPAAAELSQAPPEKPQKITLRYNGKQFSYEGLPSAKQGAVIQFISKQTDISRDAAIETFRANLPDATVSDTEIWTLVSEKIKSRQTAATAALTHGKETRPRTKPTPQTSGNQQTPKAFSICDDHTQSNDASSHRLEDKSAIEELASMTAREKEELNNFIREVLEQPPLDIASRLREDPAPVPVGMNEDTVELAQSARMIGKYPVYCCEKRTNSKKMVYITSGMTFEELESIMERKFGAKKALSFMEGDDEIEMDDDDTLAMFMQLNGQKREKPLLLCADLSDRKRVAEDDLTFNQEAVEARVKQFSNGELEVKEVRTYAGHSLAVYCCAFSPNGDQFVTASRDRSVRLWNTRTGSCTVMKGGHNGFVLSCDFSPKGNRAVSSSDDRTIKVWNTMSCAKVSTLKGHEDKVYCVQYNSTGEYIVSGSVDHTVRVWNAETCSKVTTLKGHNLAVFSCCFSNSDRGKYVCSGSDDRLVKIWDWVAGKEVRSLIGHVGTVWSVRFSHSDSYVVSASMDHELKLWDAANGACLRTMAGHKTPIHHAVFSDDDEYIFSCARDFSTMVWRTSSGEHVETITGHTSTVYHVVIQGNKMLTSSLDDTLKLWDVGRN